MQIVPQAVSVSSLCFLLIRWAGREDRGGTVALPEFIETASPNYFALIVTSAVSPPFKSTGTAFVSWLPLPGFGRPLTR